MSIIPKNRPQATSAEVRAKLPASIDLNAEKVILVGWRGYYTKTMGNPLKNDRGIYDDAMFIVTDKGLTAYNCNVDPSKFRAGIASLVKGVYKVCKWLHHGKYHALQIIKDSVQRDGEKGIDTGRHGINFHYGGDNSTWSEGCQTFPQAQFWQFQGLIYELMDQFGKKEVTYILVEN